MMPKCCPSLEQLLEDRIGELTARYKSACTELTNSRHRVAELELLTKSIHMDLSAMRKAHGVETGVRLEPPK